MSYDVKAQFPFYPSDSCKEPSENLPGLVLELYRYSLPQKSCKLNSQEGQVREGNKPGVQPLDRGLHIPQSGFCLPAVSASLGLTHLVNVLQKSVLLFAET